MRVFRRRQPRKVKDGSYIIDLRTPEGPHGRVPAEDIIGGFEVNHGHILPESYWANQDHRLVTSNGIMVLPKSLRTAWVKQLPLMIR